MKLYSDFGGRRASQVLGDLVAVAVLVVGIVVAVAIHDAIAAFKGIGADVTRSGNDFSSTMSDIGGRLSGVPLIGGGISAPFTTASDAGGTLADAGTSWQTGVEHLATLVGWTVAASSSWSSSLGWVRPRIVGAVRRAAVARLASASASLDLLAFRALATRPATAVTACIPRTVVAAWRRGDAGGDPALAALELRAAGVRLVDEPRARCESNQTAMRRTRRNEAHDQGMTRHPTRGSATTSASIGDRAPRRTDRRRVVGGAVPPLAVARRVVGGARGRCR